MADKDNALNRQVGKKMPERRRTRLEQLYDELQAYGGRVRDDFVSGLDRSAQGFADVVERGDVLTGIPRLALGGTSWLGAPVSAALSPVLGPVLQPVGEAVNTYVGQPVEDLTGYPADITNDLAMTGLTLGAAKGLGMTRPYLARAAEEVEGMANRAGYTLRKPANVYGSGPTLTPLVDEADGGLIAYHGSPHTFDKFSMDKIGTGEGAQAYGHGLYFAEAEDVAKTYRDMLSQQPQELPALGWQERMNWTDAQDEAYTLADKALEELQIDIMQGGSSRPDWSRLTDKVRQLAPRGKEDEIAGALDDLANKYGWKEFVNKNPGSMYQVRLNVKPDELLDWDRPLSEQPANVRKVVGGLVERNIDDEPGWAKLTGEKALRAVDERVGLKVKGGGEKALKAAGIKGIRYLDGGSRAAGGGTYNYVIFDDSLIDVLKRYGIPMTAAAGGGMLVIGQDMPPEVASQIGG